MKVPKHNYCTRGIQQAKHVYPNTSPSFEIIYSFIAITS